ncbi:MAG TPA: acetate/propionate family kinase [Rhodoferax sp.]|nr:acetate/propionate family kinase [Rhodoferax sp.]
MTVLAVNAGSSTLRFALHPVEGGIAQPALLTGVIEGLSAQGPLDMIWNGGGTTHTERSGDADGDGFESALAMLQKMLQRESAGRELQAVAHRVVHGGARYREATVVTDSVVQDLERLCRLAPLHQPHNVQGIRAFARRFPTVPQVACFDTAYHADLPDVEYRFALPQALHDEGVRRYGFHGLSYQYVMQRLEQTTCMAHGRVVMAHLGSGASVCGATQGQSRATSMGFSALDGLMMGTRAGALDAGVVLHLLAQGWDHARLQHLLYRQSGLLGVSEVSSDMRQLRRSDSAQADLAIRMFTYRVVREVGAMVACIGGLDVLAFTGGIGEHDATLRSEVCERLAFLGVRMDPRANALADGSGPVALHLPDSAVEVWMVPTDEGFVAAQTAVRLVL